MEDVVTINPGLLCRKQSGGTYSRIVVHPLAKENFPEHLRQSETTSVQATEDEEEMFHGVNLRTRVEIVRV